MTDIQASSLLWSRCSDAMGPALDRHDCLLRHMMLLYNGLELATEGDSFQVRRRLCFFSAISPRPTGAVHGLRVRCEPRRTAARSSNMCVGACAGDFPGCQGRGALVHRGADAAAARGVGPRAAGGVPRGRGRRARGGRRRQRRVQPLKGRARRNAGPRKGQRRRGSPPLALYASLSLLYRARGPNALQTCFAP